MKDLKKRLNQEMDERISPMSDRLKNYKINIREKKPSYAKGFGILGGLAVALAVFLIAFFLIKPKAPGLDTTTSLNSYYVLEINPTVIVEVNEDDIIKGVKSGNSDADSFLAELELKDLDIEAGMTKLANEAMREGYLMPTTGGAIRLSTIGGEDKLPSLKLALEESFMEGGYYVAIASRVFDINELNQSLNECYSSFDAYYERLKERSFMNEEIVGDIGSYYRDNSLREFLFKEINDNLDRLEEIRGLIDSIYNEYYKIRDELSIPSFIQDYWYLINTYYKDREPEPEIKAELDLMTSYLKKYEELTGEEINNKIRLDNEHAKLSLANIDLLRAIVSDIESFSKMLEDSFSYVIGLVNKTLNLLPALDEVINELTSLPTTLAEYYTKLNMIEANKKNDRIIENKAIYEANRDIISNSAYYGFIDQIIDEFGSVENYFKNIK